MVVKTASAVVLSLSFWVFSTLPKMSLSAQT
jgi:hypothetical protein